MTRTEYIEDVKLSLGAPIVEVEIDELIGPLVDKAFREIRRFITETRYKTIPYSRTGMDVREYGIDAVIQVLRTQNPARTVDFTDIYTLSTVNTVNSSSVNLLLSDYLYRTQMSQVKNTISTDLDFTYDKHNQKLYVNVTYPIPQMITLVYVPVFKDVSEVHEPFWQTYIQRLALAFCKETLGRVRGKYELSSSLYKLDGDQLIQEGLSEQATIRQELEENVDIVYPID